MTTWYREGLVSLTAGSDLVAGVGTEWVDSVLPGGIFFTPTGLVEVERVISDGSLKLVAPYAGPSVVGAEYAIAPTQGYVVDLAKQVNAVLGTFGDLKDAWQEGSLNGKGLVLKGVKNTVEELPETGNAQGDGWMVDAVLYVWSGLGWVDQGSMVTTPELEALRDAAGTSAGLAIGAALAVDTTRKGYEDRVYPGVYSSPPTHKPHSGAPSADGDRCTILVAGIPYEHLRSGGGWLIPNIDATSLALSGGASMVGSDIDGGTLKDIADFSKPLQDYAALRGYSGVARVARIHGVVGLARPDGRCGTFNRVDADTTTADNGGTVIVDSLGRRWKRQTDSARIYVKWFGAVSNDIADDTAAWLAALNVVKTNGGTLALPDGTTLVDPTDLRTFRNLTVEGENVSAEWQYRPTAILKFRSAARTGLKLATDDVEIAPDNEIAIGIVIRNLGLHGNSLVTNCVNMVRQTTLDHVSVRYAVEDGIVMEGQTYPVDLLYVVSTNNGRHGLRVKGPFTTQYRVRNSEFARNGGYGVRIEAGSSAIFDTCLCQSNTLGGWSIYHQDPATAGPATPQNPGGTPFTKPLYLERITFLNVYSEANGGFGIHIDSYNTDPATFTGKINALTFVNSAFNSGIGQHAYVRGTTNIRVVNSTRVGEAVDPLFNGSSIGAEIVYSKLLVKQLLDLSASTAGQIKFATTPNLSADPNTLDDYEEGSFSFAITQTGNIPYTSTGTTTAKYQKIGNVVTCFVHYSWSDRGAATLDSRAWMATLPYPVVASGLPTPATPVEILVAGGSTNRWSVYPQQDTRSAYFLKNGTLGAGALNGDLPATGTLSAVFSYIAAG